MSSSKGAYVLKWFVRGEAAIPTLYRSTTGGFTESQKLAARFETGEQAITSVAKFIRYNADGPEDRTGYRYVKLVPRKLRVGDIVTWGGFAYGYPVKWIDDDGYVGVDQSVFSEGMTTTIDPGTPLFRAKKVGLIHRADIIGRQVSP